MHAPRRGPGSTLPARSALCLPGQHSARPASTPPARLSLRDRQWAVRAAGDSGGSCVWLANGPAKEKHGRDGRGLPPRRGSHTGFLYAGGGCQHTAVHPLARGVEAAPSMLDAPPAWTVLAVTASLLSERPDATNGRLERALLRHPFATHSTGRATITAVIQCDPETRGACRPLSGGHVGHLFDESDKEWGGLRSGPRVAGGWGGTSRLQTSHLFFHDSPAWRERRSAQGVWRCRGRAAAAASNSAATRV